jgi:hypothetical protein
MNSSKLENENRKDIKALMHYLNTKDFAQLKKLTNRRGKLVSVLSTNQTLLPSIGMGMENPVLQKIRIESAGSRRNALSPDLSMDQLKRRLSDQLPLLSKELSLEVSSKQKPQQTSNKDLTVPNTPAVLEPYQGLIPSPSAILEVDPTEKPDPVKKKVEEKLPVPSPHLVINRRVSTMYLSSASLQNRPKLMKKEPRRNARVGVYIAKFRRIARLVMICTSYFRQLAKILRNPIEWGWEYDFNSNFLVRTNRKQQMNAKNRLLNEFSKSSRATAAVAFSILKPTTTRVSEFSGWLTPEIREMLRKPKNTRTDTDIVELQRWCRTMKAFRRFPETVQVNGVFI